MELYMQEYSPRTTAVGSGLDIFDFVRSRRALADGRSSFVKVFVSLLILLSMGLKIYSLIVFFSRMQVQAFLLTPDKTAEDGEHRRQIISMFITDFSFPEMVRDFWHARAYMVSTVIIMGSAVGPLSKHLFMLLAWLVPLSPDWQPTRRRLLFFFDQTGRTALVDLFLMGYVSCIFYTKVIQDVGGYGVELKLTGMPVRGIFFGIGSTFTGSFLSHFLLLMHDEQNMGDFENQVTVASGPAVASLMQRMSASSASKQHKVISNLCIILLIIASGTTLGFLAIEGFEIVSFRMEGLAGSLSSAKWRDFNLLTTPKHLPKENNEVAGSTFLAVLHLALVVAVPIGLLLSALALWLVPIHLRPQRRFLTLFPFWHSWCCLDIFFVTSLASYLEMHLIAEFIFDKNFHALCEALDMFGVKCVALGHEKGPGMYILFACALLFFALSHVLTHIGNELLETATNTSSDQGVSLSFSPYFDDVVNVSPLLTRMGTNDFVVLRGGSASLVSHPGGGISTTLTPNRKLASNSNFWQ